MTNLHRKSLCPSCSKAKELVHSVRESATQNVAPGEIIQTMPLVLESALSYFLSDFDYDTRQESNTAIGVRLIAIAAERARILFDAVTAETETH